MSFGALSIEAKMALAKGASMAGTATCSGEGGMIPPERDLSTKWYYQIIQSRYGFNPHHLMLADAVEFFIGQGCKVGLGGHLMGQKVTEQVAEMRSLPAGIDQRSPARHPDWLGPDDLSLKVQETREATNYEIPIQLKLGAARVYDDVRMAAKCGPDIIYLDGAEGGTGAGPHTAAEETGIPLMAAIPEARRALEDVGLADEIDLVVAGGIRNGGDVAKCIALGADAIAIGHSALMALNCNKEIPGVTDYEGTIGVPAGQCYHCHTGRCPVGITTQDPELRKRLHVEEAANRVYNFLHTLTLEVQMLARACGKTNVHSLEPEDLAALTTEAAAMAKVPLAGTDYIPGVSESNALEEIKTMLDRYLENPIDELPASGAGPRTMSASRAAEDPVAIDAEFLSGERFPYQEDIALVEDIDLEAATPGQDINWLEDVELLEEEGTPAVFDRYSNSFLKIYFPIPEGRENEIARKVLIAHLQVGQLLRDPAQGEALQVPPARARALGRGLPHGRRGLAAAGARRLGSPAALTCARSKHLVIGAGVHGLSTAWHLAEQGEEVLVVDKTGVAAGASGIACGVVRNNYFQPAMSELMAACVEIWESDPETFHYHGSGYVALGDGAQEEDLDRGLRAPAADRLRLRADHRRGRGGRAHARALPRLARAGPERVPARAPGRLRVQPRLDARAGVEGARRRRRDRGGRRGDGLRAGRLRRRHGRGDVHRPDRGRAGGGRGGAVGRLAVGAARAAAAARGGRRRAGDVDLLVPAGGRDRRRPAPVRDLERQRAAGAARGQPRPTARR